MFSSLLDHPPLQALALEQCGVFHRDQLKRLGVNRNTVANQLTAHRWQSPSTNTVLVHNTAPTRRQLMWIAVLDAGPEAALGSHTTLELRAFRSFAREARHVHLVVPRGAKTRPLSGVQVHESRRFHPNRRCSYQGLPCLDVASSAIDAAAWQRSPRFAVTVLAASVQQRLCSVEQLLAALDDAGRVRHRRHIRWALVDIQGGAESLGEIDFAALCRRYNLTPPNRQRLRTDSSGRRRYLDCEWRLAGGNVVVLEIDGSHHYWVEHWEADMRRERKLVASGRWVLRATTTEVRLNASSVVADLVALGVPRV
ncbi:MAG: hypothetical protein ACR2LE_04995 [Nocardioidaceae bacterium]